MIGQGHTLPVVKVSGKVILFAPTLFNLVVNSLSKMIHLAQQSGKILGLASHLVESGYAVLQYADDTILFIQDDITSAINLKLVLYLFEAMSGLKINFEKSEVLLVQPDDEKLLFYADLFNCQTGTWPIKYLGTLVCHRRTTVAEMQFVGERIRKGTEGWIGGALSIGGRVTKIDACLSNSAVYQMSLRLLHKTNIEELEKPIRALFSGQVVEIRRRSIGFPGREYVSLSAKVVWVLKTSLNLTLA
jgi:hypothetical protein